MKYTTCANFTKLKLVEYFAHASLLPLNIPNLRYSTYSVNLTSIQQGIKNYSGLNI